MNALFYLPLGNCKAIIIDLPERHECPAFGQNILHLLSDSIDVWCCERWIGSICDEWFDLNHAIQNGFSAWLGQKRSHPPTLCPLILPTNLVLFLRSEVVGNVESPTYLVRRFAFDHIRDSFAACIQEWSDIKVIGGLRCDTQPDSAKREVDSRSE